MENPGNAAVDTAIFGGGCFWCLEPVFRALDGVLDVQPGYCGGHVDHPTYEQVCHQDTGHVEVVQVAFDPARVGYRTLLEVFFGTHDPTTPDRQGNDVGPQYASVVFYRDEAQRALAEAVRAEAQAAFDEPIVTRIEPAGPFWPAEELHREYYRRNPGQGYCRFVIAPKLAKFRQRYAHLLR
ncbi:Peptide methionine sulfoxide reductase MsrA [Castellaniella defragrans 65Phen]|uniref:Peptide methionine sulfoxide reductase MsrA n=1 Tax=Castellaniella defragrans (strain DSM 12143 / CCUG 39792 / 65Phen) TaxID=1437824 RepID=W8X641_CASD6|nr:peptide-methionine (S)-S-oxide reductase MsrA [Castellaniella defragrans]CDM25806.1 Peptide methionine sulfoxide reductase MsrA [Castellaniella defragrans 65Phen]